MPISLTLIKNDFSLLNNILNNELPINVFDIWTNDNGPDSIGTGNKTYLRRPMITRSKFCEFFLPLHQFLLTNKKKKYRKKYLSGGHRVSALFAFYAKGLKKQKSNLISSEDLRQTH